mgnify:CR=1 FL=1
MIEIIVVVGVALITSVLGPVSVEWVKSKLNTKENPIEEAIKFNEKVDNQLEQIIDELKCDRVWLSQFHNGGYFYPTGKSIQKFSIFYEKVSDSIPSIKETFQNIPVSLFPKLVSKLYKEGEVIIHADSTAETKNLFSLTGEYDSKSSYNISLTDLNDQFIGILSISYDIHKYELNSEELDYLRNKATTVGTILSGYLGSSYKK